MNGRCETCDRESLCSYPYKPTECCDMRKFELRTETLVERATRLGVETATVGEMLDEIERLRVAVRPWALCNDKMPEPYQTCIVGRIDVPWPITAFWTGQKWCRDVTKEEFHVTHWMPLPAPPSNALANAPASAGD